MRKIILSLAILIWSVVGIAAVTIFIFAAFNLSVPDRITRLPGYHVILGGSGKMFLVNEESFPVQGVQDIRINGTYHSVIVTFHDGKDLNVRQYDHENANAFEMKADGIEIVINTEPWRFGLNSIFNFGTNPRLEIEMPRIYTENVSLVTLSGSIKIEDDAAWKDVVFNSGSGSIRINGYLSANSVKTGSASGSVTFGGPLTGETISISSSSGSIRLNGDVTGSDIKVNSTSGSVRIAGSLNCYNLNVGSVSGSINLANIFANNDVVLKSTSGSINSDDIRSSNLTIESVSGSQTSGSFKVKEEIRLISTSGRIKADTVDSKNHYIRTTSGSIRIGELIGTGDVKSTSGSVRTG